MSKPDNILDRRVANALFQKADLSLLGKVMLGFDGKIGLAISRKMIGGMWVGGNAYLTPETIEFHPGGMNKLFHTDAEELRMVIALTELVSIRLRPGVGTKIIDLNTQAVTLSLRCLNSIRFAEAIETASRKVQQPGSV